MRKNELTVGESYALNSSYGSREPKADSPAWKQVTIVDLDHRYERRVSDGWQGRMKTFTGILVRHVDGTEEPLVNAKKITRTWEQHETLIAATEKWKTDQEIKRVNHNNAMVEQRRRLTALGLTEDADFDVISVRGRDGFRSISLRCSGLDRLLDLAEAQS